MNHLEGELVMSGLTKKAVYADKILSHILGVSEGDFVSYAELSRGLHKYIKDNDLKAGSTAGISKQPAPQLPPSEPALESASTMKRCVDCGAQIPSEALFCDLCGVTQ